MRVSLAVATDGWEIAASMEKWETSKMAMRHQVNKEEYAKPLHESLTYYLVANKYNSNLSWLPEVQTILTNHVRPKLKAMC
ncbi:hypothetical protein EJB05_03548, partial [Eragrostis curvula]